MLDMLTPMAFRDVVSGVVNSPTCTCISSPCQNQSPRKNHIAERAKQSLDNSFLMQVSRLLSYYQYSLANT